MDEQEKQAESIGSLPSGQTENAGESVQQKSMESQKGSPVLTDAPLLAVFSNSEARVSLSRQQLVALLVIERDWKEVKDQLKMARIEAADGKVIITIEAPGQALTVEHERIYIDGQKVTKILAAMLSEDQRKILAVE